MLLERKEIHDFNLHRNGDHFGISVRKSVIVKKEKKGVAVCYFVKKKRIGYFILSIVVVVLEIL